MNHATKPEMNPPAPMRSSRGLRCRLMAPAVLVAIHLVSCERSGPAAPQASSGKDPVAIMIGEREVRLSELQLEIDFLHQKRSPAAQSRESFLEPCIERLVALEQARKLGLDKDPELKRQWENLLIGKLKRTQTESLLAEAKVTDEEIKAYYESNIRKYSTPAQVHLALLFLKSSARSEQASREAVRNRLEEARAKAADLPADARGFGTEAMTWSEEPTSRFKGGDIGWLKEGESSYRWPEVVVNAGFSLKEKGAVSDVIETEDGFYLLKKLDSREAEVRSLEGRMRATIEASLLKEKRSAIETSLRDNWKADEALTVHDDVISQLKFPSGPAQPGSDKTFPKTP